MDSDMAVHFSDRFLIILKLNFLSIEVYILILFLSYRF